MPHKLFQIMHRKAICSLPITFFVVVLHIYSKMIQLYIYIYLFFFKFFSHSGCYIILNSSLCSASGPCWLSILYTLLYLKCIAKYLFIQSLIISEQTHRNLFYILGYNPILFYLSYCSVVLVLVIGCCFNWLQFPLKKDF